MIRKLIGLGGALALGVLLAGVPGCGDDKPETKPDENPYPDYASFCNGVARAQCSKSVLTRCGGTGDSNETSACVSEVTRACVNKDSDVTRDIKNTSNYRKDNADACIKAIEATYAKDLIAATDHQSVRAACDPVFRGKNTAGFECENDLDCDTDLGCYRSDLSAAKGTCEKINKKAKGDDCNSKGDVCGAGLFCTPTDKICGGRPDAAGKECAATRPCIETLSCANIDPDTQKGTCSEKAATKATCTSDSECKSGFCALVGDSKLCLENFSFGISQNGPCDNFDGK